VFAGVLLLLLAAAPAHPLLSVDPSIYIDASCLAPAGAGCSFTLAAEDRSPGLSASAALFAPDARRERLLEADAGTLLDFGAQLASGSLARTCAAERRHRPDRSECAPRPRRRGR
jgi:hypothetical protein